MGSKSGRVYGIFRGASENPTVNKRREGTSFVISLPIKIRRGEGGFGERLRDRMKTVKQSNQSQDKLPPHSLEAEQGCLGCILSNPTDCMMQLLQKFPGPEVFYDLRHREVYQLLCAMHDAREPVDMLTVHQRLKDKGRVDAVGGISYLSSLPDAVPSSANLDHYADIVFDKFRLREMIQGCTEIVKKCYENGDEAVTELNQFHKDLSKLCLMTGKEADWGVKDALKEAIKDIERDIETGGALIGLSTGFPEIDRKTRGLQAGDLIVIAARPSLGKSSLVFNIADHLAVNSKIPVGAFSLEMSKKMVIRRMLSARSRVNLFKLGEDLLAQHDVDLLGKASGQLAMAPLFIDDTRGMDDVRVISGLRRMAHEHGIKVGIVDYLGLLHTRRRFDNRSQEIGEITGALKTVAGELQIPIILCVQLNRDYEKNKSQVPQISQLRESGSIEQDADLIGMLYAKGSKDDEDRNDDNTNAGLYIGKQRNGPTGNVNLTFHRSIFRFQRPGIDDKDVPTETKPDPRFKDSA